MQCRGIGALKAPSLLHIPSSSFSPLPLQNFSHYVHRTFPVVIPKLYDLSCFASFFMLLCYFFSTLLLLILAFASCFHEIAYFCQPCPTAGCTIPTQFLLPQNHVPCLYFHLYFLFMVSYPRHPRCGAAGSVRSPPKRFLPPHHFVFFFFMPSFLLNKRCPLRQSTK